MEKKTIGAFIATLRRANGMTQKELAERLNVSDKTISRWERDDGAPDLSAIPVIAEIFGVTCDELLRGERKKAAEREENPEATSARGEKERQRLLKTTLARCRDQTYIAMGISLVGFIAAMIGNLALLKAVLGFFLGAAFFVASVVCQAVFTNRALAALEDSELPTEELGRLRLHIGKIAEKSYLLTAALVGFTAPLVLVDAYMGLGSDSMLLFGIPGTLIAAAIYGTVNFFLRDEKIKKDIYVLDVGTEEKYQHNFALKKKLGKTLAIVVAATLIFHAFGGEVLWSAEMLKRGTTFTDYESFVAYMEQAEYASLSDPSNEHPLYPVKEYAPGWFSEESLKDIHGKTVCEYTRRNQDVTRVSYQPKDGTVLPITVYTYRNIEAAVNLNSVITTLFFAVYPIELLSVWLIYRKKKMK